MKLEVKWEWSQEYNDNKARSKMGMKVKVKQERRQNQNGNKARNKKGMKLEELEVEWE